MNILNFTAPHIPSIGGLYTAQESFRRIAGNRIIDVVPNNLYNQTYSDYQIQIVGFGIKDNYGIPLPFSLPVNFFDTYQSIKKMKPELIVIHSLFSCHSIIGYLIAKKLSVPYLLILHGILDPYVFSYRSRRKLTWINLIGQKIINQSEAVVCSTQREAIKAFQFLEQANVEICPWGVDIPNPAHKKLWREEIRQKLGLHENEKVLLFLGRLSPIKRLLETALAFKKLNLPRWKFLIVGYKEDEEIFEQIKNLSQENDNIIYHKSVEGIDKWKFLACSDAFISMSRKENFGYSVVEAAFMQLPLLISEGIDIYSYFQSERAGVVSRADTNDCILNDLSIFLSQSDDELRNMGIKAGKVANANFTYEKFEDNLKSIFHKYKL